MKNAKVNMDINFQAVFEAVPGLLLILKPNLPHFTILGASDAYLQATMRDRNKISGQDLFHIFPDNPKDSTTRGADNLRKSLERVIEKKISDTMALQKYDILRPESEGGGFEERYWSPLNAPVLNKNNEVLYIIHKVEDVTDFIRSKQKGVEEIRIAKRELDEKSLFIKNNDERVNNILDILLKYTQMDFSEQMMVSKNGDELDAIAVGLNTLSEELQSHIMQIEESNKQLESVNKELEGFSYSISHDLRAPLRAISGYANILLEDYTEKLDEDALKIINVVINNTKKMGDLIDDLLAFSRLGRKEITASEINMTALVKSVKEDLLLDYIKERTEFNYDELVPAKGDVGLIKQVWVNLISNAVKYSQHKPKTSIEIGAYNKDNHIVYYVKDNGAGFDMQYYNKLFGVFQRLHSQEEFEGTGIGLAIVQKIVNRHNGTVWAESKLNEGSCFYFSLPNINT
jgi:signal transduction histidine kinase